MAHEIIDIAGRKVGAAQPCFIIAEAGVNHNGSIEMARRLVDVAVEAEADAVKFQTFKAERLVAPHAAKAEYQTHTTDPGESHLEMLRSLELSLEMHVDLMSYCRENGIIFISSPFEEGSCDLLDELAVPAFKIPSGEITNLPFLAHVAAKGKPMIVSSGMSYISEVEGAVRTIEGAGNNDFVLLHCVSNYPTDPADVNLRAMQTMASAFRAPAGYSDHTLGIEIPLAAVALGACVIEKHFTLDSTLTGPDHRASLEPDQLTAMVRGIRTVEAALGHGRKKPAASEANTASVARKSLVAASDLQPGTMLAEEMIAVMRPGTGLPPVMRPHIVGRTLRTPVRAGELITLDNLE